MVNKMTHALICCMTLLPLTALAGNLEPTREPATGSGMPTLQAIFNQLAYGTTASTNDTFQEPLAGPTAGTGVTLSDILSITPRVDTANGATVMDVLPGKTFFGLRSGGGWGSKTGSMQLGSISASSTKVSYGYYANNLYLNLIDTDLADGNIKSGVNIFGISGSLIPAVGTAYDQKVLTGYTFSNSTASEISGAMPDRGAMAFTAGTSQQMIPAGYHNGSGYVSGDTGLQSYNIRSGTSIFGVAGKTEVIDTTLSLLAATAADIASGKRAFLNGSMITGTATIVTYPYPAPVPKTGQYAPNGAGTDGNLQKGETWPYPRFTDNSNGTVTDNLTGLVWLKKVNCVGTTRDWSTALADIVQLNTNGTMNGNNCGDTSNAGSNQTDWRLPNVRELFSVIDFQYTQPAVPNTTGGGNGTNDCPFTGIVTSYHWTSTSYNDSFQDSAWYISLFYGFVAHDTKTTANKMVWAVRGGK